MTQSILQHQSFHTLTGYQSLIVAKYLNGEINMHKNK